MKILGTSGNQKFIVECDDEELKNITGRLYHERFQLAVGDVIKVAPTWRKLSDILELQSEFDKVAATLSGMQTVLGHVGGGIVERLGTVPVGEEWD